MLVNQRQYIKQFITCVDTHLLKYHFFVLPVDALRNRNELPFFAPIGFSTTNVSGFRTTVETHLDSLHGRVFSKLSSTTTDLIPTVSRGRNDETTLWFIFVHLSTLPTMIVGFVRHCYHGEFTTLRFVVFRDARRSDAFGGFAHDIHTSCQTSRVGFNNILLDTPDVDKNRIVGNYYRSNTAWYTRLVLSLLSSTSISCNVPINR